MDEYLIKLKECHETIKNGFYGHKYMPSVESQRELLAIAETCIGFSKHLSGIRHMTNEIRKNIEEVES